ncbi:Uncharacterised protein [Mycobacterium tuberculosis]|uniref:Uncharacterized protein n=1 Tax=Mycobacterium tuberculosis TaxID=1773 RepID=A0A0U0R1X1_MYCTX|nr:Uncharacterised protein [Mycobacterium tuberculosis]
MRHKEFSVNLSQLIRQPAEVQVLRHNPMPQRQDCLHQPQGPRCRLQVTEVCFHRRQRARTLGSVHRGQARVFDRISNGGAGAVGFDHPHRRRFDARCSQRLLIHRDLSLRRRRRDIHGAAILVGCGATNDRQHTITVAHRIR